jgi:hypothetical protein
MARYNSAPKVRVNVGGMTQSQADMILRLANSNAWELEPRASYRDRTALLINDIENNPATSPLTGGWDGTASKLISYLKSCPVRVANAVPVMDATSGASTPDDSESDPWADDIANPNYESAMSTAHVIEAPKHTTNSAVELVGPGVYVYMGQFFSVKESTKNPGRHYAHKISLVGNKFKHTYAAGVIFKLTEEMRASADVIVAMNKDTIYTNAKGQRVGSCCVCGRMLTKKASVDAGIGPVCGGRVGL